MRCVITGHSRKIGKALAEYFETHGWEVIGLSSSSGYNVDTRYSEMVEIAKTADLFINNLCVGDCALAS
jgi:nucleoside-diphosphate-sugar epimerase